MASGPAWVPGLEQAVELVAASGEGGGPAGGLPSARRLAPGRSLRRLVTAVLASSMRRYTPGGMVVSSRGGCGCVSFVDRGCNRRLLGVLAARHWPAHDDYDE